MDENSRTAVLAAVTRGMHTEMSGNPLLDDQLASKLYTNEEKQQITDIGVRMGVSDEDSHQLGDAYSPTEAWEMAFDRGAFAASSVARNRYAEDCLEAAHRERGIDQYVVVGAGLDTFAWRRPELADELTIIELDHPDVQRFKRERLDEAGLDIPNSVHFAPVNLETERVSSALADTAYDSGAPAFYSWLGVTPYLPSKAIFGTLQDITETSVAGSEIVFDFVDTEGSAPETTTDRIRRFIQMVEQMGASTGDGLGLATFEERMNDLGLEVVELLSPDGQRRRYFSDQPDYFGPTEHYHFAHVKIT